ncbi:proton-conducting transporter membrane subunit, partial [Rhizobium ruizarguesonis]
LTSITSFLLIGFDHERAAARRAALQSLVVTGGGGLCLLAGLLLLWDISGVTEMSRLIGTGDVDVSSQKTKSIRKLSETTKPSIAPMKRKMKEK